MPTFAPSKFKCVTKKKEYNEYKKLQLQILQW